jgi:D-sedoheptulose 7-phosphate isomerase
MTSRVTFKFPLAWFRHIGPGVAESDVTDVGMTQPADTAAGAGMTAGESAADAGQRHLEALASVLSVLDNRLLDDWGRRLAAVVRRGGRLLVAGNGGSAPQAQQLAAELTGRFAVNSGVRCAIALHSPRSMMTGIGNDSGDGEAFARHVRAHGRPGDVLLLISTSGRSRNLVRAASAARAGGLTTWCLTGPLPNPIADACDEAVCVYPAGARALALTATVQAAHQVALHLICLSFHAAA